VIDTIKMALRADALLFGKTQKAYLFRIVISKIARSYIDNIKFGGDQ
jgi:hypothetical protein